MTYASGLRELTRHAGVRGALVVSAPDGLVVADALMEGVDGGAVAALAASLAGRMRTVSEALGHKPPELLHLVGTEGTLLAVPAAGDLLVVAVTALDVNAGAVRLALRRVAQEIA